jgi:S1-C subfamily serine protease
MRGLGAVAAVALFGVSACTAPSENWAPLAGLAPGGSRELIGGTGFLLPGGYILTARHVVTDCKAIRATARSGAFEAASARVAATPSNPLMDMAALQLDRAVPGLGHGARLRDLWPTGGEPVRAGGRPSPWPRIEEELVALGYPGAAASMDPVAAPLSQILAARLTNQMWRGDAFAVFGNITHGDSGGPIVDKSGRVVGMMFAIAFEADELHKQGIKGSVGFGLRAHDIASFLAEAGLPSAMDSGAGPVDGSVDRLREDIVRVFCYR